MQFQIVIPVYNAVGTIDQTMQSIWRQQFDREKIYTVIVDFGSTDGTYQKILGYDPFHLGIYRVNEDFSELGRTSEAGRIASYTKPRGENCCQILLQPGDIIYSDSLNRVAQAVNRHCSASVIISETDVKTGDGSVVRLRTLYDSEKVIDGETEYLEYLSKGYRHNVMCFGGEVYCGHCYINGQANDKFWWNKNFFANFERDAVYIPEYLGCIQERFYGDELGEILLRWGNIIRFRRFFVGRFELNSQESQLVSRNMAHYILWRSYLLAGKGDERQARECFLLSTILFPDIRDTQIYQWLEEYVLEKDPSAFSKIHTYFQMTE